MNSLFAKMQDLLEQATTERSHYYVASVLTEAMQEIAELNLTMRECADCIREGDEFAALRILEVALLRNARG